MVGTFTKGSTRTIAILGLIALLFAMIAPALSIRKADAAIPTTVTVVATNAAGTAALLNGGAGATGIINTATGATSRVLVDIDDGDANAGFTDETNVSLTTNIGTWTSTGAASAIVPCALDDGTSTNIAAVAAVVGPPSAPAIPAISLSDPGNVPDGTLPKTVENEVEVDADADGDVAHAAADTDEGCGGVDDFVQIGSTTTGTVVITAQAQNGGASFAYTTPITPFAGTAASLTLLPDQTGAVIAGNFPGYVSPDNAVNLVAIPRDAAANNLSATSTVLFSIDAGALIPGVGGLIIATVAGCTGATANSLAAGPAAAIIATWCAATPNSATAPTNLGEKTVTASLVGSALTGTVKATHSAWPAKLTLTATPFVTTSDVAASQTDAASASVTAKLEDGGARPVADGTAVTFSASGAAASTALAVIAQLGVAGGTLGGNARALVTVDRAGGVRSIALAASAATIGGGVVQGGTTLNIPGATTPTGTGTPTPGGPVTVTPNSPYQAGPNAVVVQGSGTAAAVSANIATSASKTVLALWLLTGGAWVYFLPANPSINGGLANFPGPVASAVAVLS